MASESYFAISVLINCIEQCTAILPDTEANLECHPLYDWQLNLIQCYSIKSVTYIIKISGVDQVVFFLLICNTSLFTIVNDGASLQGNRIRIHLPY